MYKFLLLLICLPFYTFGQDLSDIAADANRIIINTEDKPATALNKLVAVLIEQNFYIEHIDKEYNILTAYKLDETSKFIKFKVQGYYKSKLYQNKFDWALPYFRGGWNILF